MFLHRGVLAFVYVCMLSGVTCVSSAAAAPFPAMGEDVAAGSSGEPPISCNRGCDGVCHSGLVRDDCGVCGGDGTLCDPLCPLYELRLWDTNFASDGTRINQGGGSHKFIEGADYGEFASCFEGLYEQALNVCSQLQFDNLAQHGDRYLNDCYAAVLGNAGNGIDFFTEAQSAIAACRQNGGGLGGCGRQVIRDLRKVAEDKTVIFGDDCSAKTNLSAGEAAEACDGGDFYWKGTPVSLLWDEAADVEQDKTVTNFPLEPGKPGAAYVWKASAQAPLLVYDPAHSGEVTSATQLFGRWTFGGKRLAFAGGGLESLFNSPDFEVQWANGYEAMAVLDLDRDSKLSGDELRHISLWFDDNRDGVSQAGEVRKLQETGVVTLFYAPDYRDPLTGNLYAGRGYERQVGGKIVTGKSVDWTADAARSAAALLLKKQLGDRPECSEAPQSGREHVRSNSEASGPAEANAEQELPDLSGFWLWKSKDGQSNYGHRLGGSLLLTPRPDGTLEGYSFTEYGLGKKSGLNAGSIISLTEGTWKQGADGTVHMRFSLAGLNKSALLTEVTYVPGERPLLRGKSKYRSGDPKGTTNLEYSWQAMQASKPKPR